MKRYAPIALAVMVIAFLANPAWAEEGAASPSDPVGEAIGRALHKAAGVGGDVLESRESALRFYEARGFAPAWTDGRAKRDGRELIEAIEDSKSHGLCPGRYHLEAIRRLQGELAGAEGVARDRIAADIDILMTDAFFTLAAHLDAGVANPYFSNANQRRPRSDTDLAAVLAGALARHDVGRALEGLAPQTDDYRRLRKALEKAEETAATADWPKVPAGSKRKIEPGDSDPTIPAIRARLAAEGFIESPNQSRERTRMETDEGAIASPAEPSEDFYGEDLVEGVMLFQKEYGLKVDGVIGRRTLVMMNREPGWRVCQIKVNLDRLRALKHAITTGRYAVVNIPDFSLTIYEGGKRIKRMKVIVGMLDRKSPLMSDKIRFIVFSPKWHVPTSIAVKDKLPKIRKDPAYIRRHGMKLYAVGDAGIEEIEPESVDWESLSLGNFPYRIVQGAGDANALGRVKFMFPNRHAVYLHDTPTKYLFDRGQRTYSSGCIRISDPIWFAKYLLADRDGWDEEKIKGAMRRAAPLVVGIEEHLPIHILYITAWADDDGEPVYRHDVYGYDAAVAKKLCDG